MSKKKKLKIFISYSHEDKKYKKTLLSHLQTLELTHNIDVWHDGVILAGQSINSEVLKQLSISDIVLLLVSPHFLASYYCIKIELEKAIERHNKGECIIIPVILSKCNLDKSLPFFSFMRVPEDGKPIQSFNPQNNGYVNAVAIIKQAIDAKFINTRKSSVKEPSSPITINLYQDGKELPYVIDDNTWLTMHIIKDRIIDFQKIMFEKVIDFVLQYKTDYSKAKKKENMQSFRHYKFKSFLLDVSLTIREWLFKDVGVRVHFRILNKNKYIGFVVVDGNAKRDANCDWGRKITPMSTTSGMIYHSGELNAPLIKSKNEEWHQKGKHDDMYVDYITAALKFKDMCTTANPLMSMGISIEKDFNKKYASYLVALVYFRFDVIVENLIVILCSEIKKIDKDFELSSIIQ